MRIKYFLLGLFLFTEFFVSLPRAQAAALVGHWKLDETTQGTDAVDSGTGGNNGSTFGSAGGPLPTSTVPTVSFADPGSFYFNGLNQGVQIASSFRSAVSVTFWFKPLANGSGNGNDNWYNGTGLFDAEIGGVTNDFGVTWSADHVEFGIGNPDRTIRSGALALGSWYHVAATWQKSDGAMKLYINGSLVDSTTGSLNDRISTNVRFGVLLSGVNAYYNGYMDDIRTFDVALDLSQVQNMANGNSLTLTDADNVSSSRSRVVMNPNPDPITPSEGFFTLRLNEGANTTESSLVRISSNAGPDIVNVHIAKNGSFSAGTIAHYTNGMVWDLCWWQKPCAAGIYTIEAKFMNSVGVYTPVVSDTIELVTKVSTSTPERATTTPVTIDTKDKLTTWDDIYAFQKNPQVPQVSTDVFGKDLKFGDVNEDVKKLQKFLNAQGFVLATTKVGGAPGRETKNFQYLTYNALIKFQTYYQTQIGKAPNGVFDSETRKVANGLGKK